MRKFEQVTLPGSGDTREKHKFSESQSPSKPYIYQTKKWHSGCLWHLFSWIKVDRKGESNVVFLAVKLFSLELMLQAPTTWFSGSFNVGLRCLSAHRENLFFSRVFWSGWRHVLTLSHFVATSSISFSQSFSFLWCVVNFCKPDTRVSFSLLSPVQLCAKYSLVQALLFTWSLGFCTTLLH